ncbi:MAG: BatA and WFA domain-containing protein [Candidatus Kapabacteria bacterium]|nr:BatA and WFA domain-containing protein [Candidatus Kapabacteria bacterium]
MNFLNPFALLGLAAASIPVLLHLLNLRKLRVIEFSSLRFLLELQQTRVRKLRLQQILLLILRTLLILFAVLSIARPTIPGSLPLLSSTSRSSVVILIDNSGSMEAADARGQRLRQAQEAARQIVASLQDGDEVAVLPMTGIDPDRAIDFTRTFNVALEQINRVSLTEGASSAPQMLRTIRPLLDDALHLHREIYIVSDAQASLAVRASDDSGRILEKDASVFLVRIGDGQNGLEPNMSVDSIQVITKLLQSDKPIEIEASVRNGSERDATGVLISMAFDGVRVAQRAVDIPAGTTRSVTLAAPPQRIGMVAASIELENDAIDRDNIRWVGFTVPARARVGLVGPGADAVFVRTVLTLPGMERGAPFVQSFSSVTEASVAMSDLDVVILSGGTVSQNEISLVRQFVEGGGGLLMFASEQAGIETLALACGLQIGSLQKAPDDAPFGVTTTDRTHPLFAGVFKNDRDRDRGVESPRIWKIRPASGGVDIVQTGAGALVSEQTLGRGRVIYSAVAPTLGWSTYPGTGLFAAFVVRSILYCVAPRDQGLNVLLGQPVRVPVPPKLAGRESFVIDDATRMKSTVTPVRLPSSTMVSVPPQFRSGVVKVSTTDSLPVVTVAANGPTNESRLIFLSKDKWKPLVDPLVGNADHVVEVSADTSMHDVVQAARTGSELWPLCVLLALACAIAEMLVSRFMAQETAAPAAS